MENNSRVYICTNNNFGSQIQDKIELQIQLEGMKKKFYSKVLNNKNIL